MIEKNRAARELKQATPYITAYVFLWSCTYLYNYWSAFNINPLPYISFNEIITNSSAIISQASVFALIILAIEAISPVKFRESYTIGNTKNNNLQLTIYLIAGTLTIVAFFQWGNEYDYLRYMTYSTMIAAARPLSLTAFYQTSFSNYPTRVAIAAFTIFLPISAIITPIAKANDIRNQKGEQDIITRPLGLCKNECILVGKLGDFFMLLDKSNKTHMLKSSEMPIFSISQKNLK
ncbi:hypothetical protein OXH62_01310 [Pseudomonas chlororaphis]|uniref:hypothetical protein n=1 Tax=Pseudomonas chlororaphis TaxID=587753 RepID=UPI0035D426F9